MAALSRRLADALDAIEIAPDGRTARVGQRTVTAADAAALRRELTAAIYDELHAGRAAPDIAPGRPMRDLELEQRLGELLPHKQVIRPAQVLGARDGLTLIWLDGLKVWVPADSIDAADQPVRAGTCGTVRIPAGRPALSPGFFLTDSVRPYGSGETVMRVYVHLVSVSAVLDAWDATLSELADLGVSYRAKVASWPEMLPRRDALVLYLADHDLDVARRIAAVTRRLRGIGPQVSAFAEPVAPGVAVACEPADPRPGMRGLSFGEHRAAVLADGLLTHAEQRAAGQRGTVRAAVCRAFAGARIDPVSPARNLSPDSLPRSRGLAVITGPFTR
jgi:hypothetical protein